MHQFVTSLTYLYHPVLIVKLSLGLRSILMTQLTVYHCKEAQSGFKQPFLFTKILGSRFRVSKTPPAFLGWWIWGANIST